MLMCSYMAPKNYIGAPRKIGRVLCPADHETIMRPAPRGFDKQRFEGDLAIGSISPEVRQCGARSRRRSRSVVIRIYAAVQRRYSLRAEPVVQPCQRRT
jgi:hypothetical protein